MQSTMEKRQTFLHRRNKMHKTNYFPKRERMLKNFSTNTVRYQLFLTLDTVFITDTLFTVELSPA